MDYTHLSGLDVTEYQHPSEKLAFEQLKKIPFLDQLTAAYIRFMVDLNILPEIQGDCFRITNSTAPRVYRLYRTALERLDMPEEYPLFAKNAFEYNATAYGGENPFILIHSSILLNFDDDEIIATLGHELGHIKGGHSVYDMMASQINLWLTKIRLPGINLLTSGIDLALMQWRRTHEYSADRAGMLAAGGVEPSIKVMLRLMGIDGKQNFASITKKDLLSQHTELIDMTSNIIMKLLYAIELGGIDHPFGICRVQEAYKWYDSGEFAALVNRYARR